MTLPPARPIKSLSTLLVVTNLVQLANYPLLVDFYSYPFPCRPNYFLRCRSALKLTPDTLDVNLRNLPLVPPPFLPHISNIHDYQPFSMVRRLRPPFVSYMQMPQGFSDIYTQGHFPLLPKTSILLGYREVTWGSYTCFVRCVS